MIKRDRDMCVFTDLKCIHSAYNVRLYIKLDYDILNIIKLKALILYPTKY